MVFTNLGCLLKFAAMEAYFCKNYVEWEYFEVEGLLW